MCSPISELPYLRFIWKEKKGGVRESGMNNEKPNKTCSGYG